MSPQTVYESAHILFLYIFCLFCNTLAKLLVIWRCTPGFPTGENNEVSKDIASSKAKEQDIKSYHEFRPIKSDIAG